MSLLLRGAGNAVGIPITSPEGVLAVAFWPLDETSGNRLDARGGVATLVQSGTVGSTTLGNGKIAANFTNVVANWLGVRNNGLNLTGGGSYSVCGFARTSNIADTDPWLELGTGSPSHAVGPALRTNANKIEFRHPQQNGSVATLQSVANCPVNTDLFFCITYNEAAQEISLRYTTDGSTILTTNASVAGVGYEIWASPFFSLGSRAGLAAATVALAQVLVTRDVISNSDFFWYANLMNGRSNSEVIDKIGSYPALQPAPISLREHDSELITSAELPVSGTYWMRPYPLYEWDAPLSAQLGRYVWAASSDHAMGSMVNGIVIGFSDDPAIPPTRWRLIWQGPQVLEGGRTYSQSETPHLVYNPDDPNGRKFYLYLHETAGSISGYTVPQETRLISSTDLLTWTNEGNVIPVNTSGGLVNNHKGYATVFRDGPTNWIAIHLLRDGAGSQVGYSTSTDGKVWTNAEWLSGSAIPVTSMGLCEPGKRVSLSEFNRVTINGVLYALTKYDNSPASNANENDRGVVLVPLNSLGLPDGRAPLRVNQRIGVFPGNDYLQGVRCYDESGVLHIYEKFGYPQTSGVDDLVKYSTAVIDAGPASTARPIGVKAVTSGASVTISWHDALPHTNYRVYRSAQRNTGFALLAEVNGTSYTDTTSDHWYYLVRSFSGATESVNSAVVAGGKYDPDAINFFERVEFDAGSTAFDLTSINGIYTIAYNKTKYDTLVTSLKSANLWSKVVELGPYMRCTYGGLSQKLKYANYPWRRLIGFSTSDYTPAGGTPGLIGDGVSKHVRTEFFDSFGSDNRGFGVYCTTEPSSGTRAMMGSGNVDTWMLLRSASNMIARIPQDDAGIVLGSPSAGFWYATRRGVNDVEGYRNGVSVATDTATASGVGSGREWASFAHFTTTASFFSDDRRVFDVWTTGLTSLESASLNSILAAFVSD